MYPKGLEHSECSKGKLTQRYMKEERIFSTKKKSLRGNLPPDG